VASQPDFHVALLTAGKDKPYAFGIASALLANGVRLDLVAGEELDLEEFRHNPRVKSLLFRNEPRPDATFASKAIGILLYYARLICYAWSAQPTIFHILWNNKFETFDRVVLMLYYRLLGKRVVLTAHNVNTAERDASDTVLNRLTLRCQYQLCDHVFVHTDQMKADLIAGYGVSPDVVSVIPFGINNAVPRTALTTAGARQRLGIGSAEKTILFFGNIAPYKGLAYLTEAFRRLLARDRQYRLIIAGRPKQGFEEYWDAISTSIRDGGHERIILKIQFIPDDETEMYFKAADVLVLPYTSIFQSGVLFLGYSFGLPVLAADVGSLRDEIVAGRTGYVFAPEDATALERAIEMYFESDCYRDLPNRRQDIEQYANEKYSWVQVANVTLDVYEALQLAKTSDVLVSRPPRG
jgi:glycosyltransferase involved in cell wall biosynthesis